MNKFKFNILGRNQALYTLQTDGENNAYMQLVSYEGTEEEALEQQTAMFEFARDFLENSRNQIIHLDESEYIIYEYSAIGEEPFKIISDKVYIERIGHALIIRSRRGNYSVPMHFFDDLSQYTIADGNYLICKESATHIPIELGLTLASSQSQHISTLGSIMPPIIVDDLEGLETIRDCSNSLTTMTWLKENNPEATIHYLHMASRYHEDKADYLFVIQPQILIKLDKKILHEWVKHIVPQNIEVEDVLYALREFEYLQYE